VSEVTLFDSIPAAGKTIMATSRFLLLASLVSSLAGCTTYFTDGSKLSCVLTQEYKAGRIILRAKVRNHSNRTVTFFDHPDFASFMLLGKGPSDHQGFGGRLISYNPPTREDFKVVPPGRSTEFQAWFKYRRLSGDKVRVSGMHDDDDTCLYIRSSYLRAEFSYGASPSFLPRFAGLAGRNYVFHPQALVQPDEGESNIIRISEVFRAP
jgi:hypothetical protein